MKKHNDENSANWEELLKQYQQMIHELKQWHSQWVPKSLDKLMGVQASYRLMAGNQGGEYFEFWAQDHRWVLFFSSVTNFKDSTKVLERLIGAAPGGVEALFFQDPQSFIQKWSIWMTEDQVREYDLGLAYWDPRSGVLRLFNSRYPKICLLTQNGVEWVQASTHRFDEGERLPPDHWVCFWGRGWDVIQSELPEELAQSWWQQSLWNQNVHEVRHYFFESALRRLDQNDLKFDLALVVFRIDQPRIQVVT